MDAPRRWQVASVATAVASMSLGGLLLARPTSETVAPIELDPVVDGRELSVASPTDAGGPTATDEDHRIVTPEVPSSFAEVDAQPATPDPAEPGEAPADEDAPAEADSPDEEDDVPTDADSPDEEDDAPTDADSPDEEDDAPTDADSPDDADSIDSP